MTSHNPAAARVTGDTLAGKAIHLAFLAQERAVRARKPAWSNRGSATAEPANGRRFGARHLVRRADLAVAAGDAEFAAAVVGDDLPRAGCGLVAGGEGAATAPASWLDDLPAAMTVRADISSVREHVRLARLRRWWLLDCGDPTAPLMITMRAGLAHPQGAPSRRRRRAGCGPPRPLLGVPPCPPPFLALRTGIAYSRDEARHDRHRNPEYHPKDEAFKVSPGRRPRRLRQVVQPMKGVTDHGPPDARIPNRAAPPDRRELSTHARQIAVETTTPGVSIRHRSSVPLVGGATGVGGGSGTTMICPSSSPPVTYHPDHLRPCLLMATPKACPGERAG